MTILTHPEARNGDINGVISSVKQMEDRFNKKFQYPYVFLNDVQFEEKFKTWVNASYYYYRIDRWPCFRRVSELTDATVQFGLIPPDHWHQPKWIDESKATAERDKMVANNVIYGGKWCRISRFSASERTYRQCSVGDLSHVRMCAMTTPLRYRNMCRFNSGVSLVRASITTVYINNATVLLQAWTSQAV